MAARMATRTRHAAPPAAAGLAAPQRRAAPRCAAPGARKVGAARLGYSVRYLVSGVGERRATGHAAARAMRARGARAAAKERPSI